MAGSHAQLVDAWHAGYCIPSKCSHAPNLAQYCALTKWLDITPRLRPKFDVNGDEPRVQQFADACPCGLSRAPEHNVPLCIEQNIRHYLAQQLETILKLSPETCTA